MIQKNMSSNKASIEVSIYLHGNQLDPERISKLVKLEPTCSQVKGKFKDKGEKYPAKIGMWSLTAQTDSDILSKHVDELMDKMSAFNIHLDKLDGVESAKLDIFISLDEGHRGKDAIVFDLNKKQIDCLHRLGLAISVTLL